jgi:ABC-2 type transport system permease protein
VSRPDTLIWLASHEIRLGWRDWVSMMTAGRRSRARTIAIALIVFAVFMHLVAWSMVGRYAGAGPGKATLVVVTGTVLLSWALLLSQAMESVTRAFYTRSDLDLILTSPVSQRKVFSVRIGRIAVSGSLVAILLATPFIDVLAVKGGVRWLSAFGVVAAMGAVAAAFAVALTIALFRTIGPKRTRLVAQIVAAVIGASFVIGLQVAAILSYGSLSRFALLQSDWLIARMPDVGSAFWWPARAAMGDAEALVVVMALSLALLGASIAIFSGRFGDHAVAAAGVSNTGVRQRRLSQGFRGGSPQRVLRQKEWTLLRRDPWLMSQTLMQMLYLLPPALLLWRGFRDGTGALVVLVPVLVMAAGQLAGGLAWLSISGEDAPDLVATAPILGRRIIWAKIEAVMGAVAFVFASLVAARLSLINKSEPTRHIRI